LKTGKLLPDFHHDKRSSANLMTSHSLYEHDKAK